MKKSVYILLSILLLSACEKDEKNEPLIPEKVILKSYIKSLATIDTVDHYTGDYYIHVSFKNQENSEQREITYTTANQSFAIASSQSPDNSVLGEGCRLKDTITREELEVLFHYCPKTDTLFSVGYANYRFADPWRNITGVNINYLRPVESRPTAYYLYVGTNAPGSYFIINYINQDRINGKFKTIWKECCGEKTTYSVSGDFSIPIVYPFIYF